MGALLALLAVHLSWSPYWPWNAGRRVEWRLGWLSVLWQPAPSTSPDGSSELVATGPPTSLADLPRLAVSLGGSASPVIPSPTSSPSSGPLINLWDVEHAQLRTMTMEEYLVGVVAAEMPANFPKEALKAQAVAARTLALRALAQGVRVSAAPAAQLSSDYRAGQAWASPETLRRRWGPILWYFNQRRIRQAVQETSGVVLTYQGELIFPAFHSTSGGRTEASENYWATALPYLRSVDSPGEEGSPFYHSRVVKSVDEVAAQLGMKRADRPSSLKPSSSDVSSWRMEVVSAYPSGRVAGVRFAGLWYSGREVREKLGLRSSWFTVRNQGDQIIFDVRGYGHGVGMSQYGAAALARRGQTFGQILSHYYSGVALARAY